MLEDILNTRTDKIPMCFRKSIKTLKKLRKYVVNSLKYDYTVNVNIKMYKKWKIKMYNLGSTIHQLSYHQ